MKARARRAQERGFTLIELLVASIAGLFVVLAAFMLSRGATRLFASEGRVGNSQLNLRLGLDRLRQDLDRAAYMTTPNVRLDPDVCPDPTTLGFPMRLQSLHYQMGAVTTSKVETPLSADNGLTPDKLTISGNFASTDVYFAATIEPSSGGAGQDIVLQQLWGSSARLQGGGETGSPAESLAAVFAPGRIVRIRNPLGSSQYAVVESASIGAGGRALIRITATPQYTVTTGSSVVKRCGAQGHCIGCEINPVHMVRYEVRSLANDPRFTWAYGEDGRTDKDKYDLVRTELRANGTVIEGTEEIVAEYAVDLAFAFGVDTSPPAVPGAAWTEPSVMNLAFGDPDNAKWGGDILTTLPGDTSTGIRPQRIRSVRYRLTTRTRFPDHTVASGDAGPGLSRYQISAERFSRARTIVGEVSLVNQEGVRW